MVEVEKLIGEIEDLIKELAEVTPVHGGFYQLSAKYYKVQLLSAFSTAKYIFKL